MVDPDRHNDIVQRYADGFAELCAIYGFNPTLGRLYAVLLLSPEPISLAGLCEAIGAAKSTVSVAIRRLEAAEVVRRCWKPGDRRDWYEAVDDPASVLASWHRLYLAAQLEKWSVLSADTEAELAGDPELVRRMRSLSRVVESFEANLTSDAD